jgi:hypothetical protein
VPRSPASHAQTGAVSASVPCQRKREETPRRSEASNLGWLRLSSGAHDDRRAQRSSGFGDGPTQTVRNYGASLGFAILGTLLISEFRSAVTSSLSAQGLPRPAAAAEAAKIAQLQLGGGSTTAIPLFIRADFAHAVQDVLYAMAVIMAVAAFVALRGGRRDTRRGERRLAAGEEIPRESLETQLAGSPDGRFEGPLAARRAARRQRHHERHLERRRMRHPERSIRSG